MTSQGETSAKPVADGQSQGSLPPVSLPKGGGAIRGIGEKFAANPVTGSGSMTIPIATSPGRSGFGPLLSLAYDSGAGNGPFGFGWNLSLPSITRKTDKGLPQYNDGGESDVFILSAAEDLVPVYLKDSNADWERDEEGNPVVQEEVIDGYRVRRYRPRIEGLFARIERWTLIGNVADSHWRSISKDNVLTLYGASDESRIADPEDPSRIFSWLICETRDDKGNAVVYKYKKEDGIGAVLTQAHERNRGDRQDPRRSANRYLKRICYGNRLPLPDRAGHGHRWLTQSQVENADWMFEVVFDYSDHDTAVPKTRDDEEKDGGDPKWPWYHRQDAFSTYRAGFEIRTARRCKRVLMFHHFEHEEGVGKDCLVRSTDFNYSSEENPAGAPNPIYKFLRSVTQTSYRRDNGSYKEQQLPSIEFQYTQPLIQEKVEEVSSESLENLPMGVDGSLYQWIDLHGEGIPGVLTEQAGAWFYKRNLSPISAPTVDLAPTEVVATKPNLAMARGEAQFMDLAGDGLPDLVMLDGPMPGLYEHDDEESWQAFRAFTSRLNRITRDPNLRFLDLNGDGHADVLISEDATFVWHNSLGESGFGEARHCPQALEEEKGPRLVFADGTESVYVADLSGDGLHDLVRIRNGEICYWPNLGYGRFGAKVTMDNAPQFDNPDQFDQKRIRLADIDGSGTTDIIYLHGEGIQLYFNQSGNSWSASYQLKASPPVDNLCSIITTDLLGNGTACLVWSSPLPDKLHRSVSYVNLMGEEKPHLLVKTINNLGAQTVVQYAPSIKFYLEDKLGGKPWITRLPFPVHVVERVETFDHISRNRFVTRYAYHHGYFDGEEREFRGFGMVEQWDTEEIGAFGKGETLPAAANLDSSSHVPAVLTRTWFHTGVYVGRDRISNFFAGLNNAEDTGEYYREPGLSDQEASNLGLDERQRRLHDDATARKRLLDDTTLPEELSLDEEREACRSLKGMLLRQEVYSLDKSANEKNPYTVLEQNFRIRLIQPREGNRHAVFLTHPRESITCHYERNPVDPRTQHALTLEVDGFGNVLKQASVGYGRRQPDASLPRQFDRDTQTQTLITYTENRVTNAIDEGSVDDYRTPLPCETRTYELTGHTPTSGERFQLADFAEVMGANVIEISYEQPPPTAGKQRRLIEHIRTLYRPDDFGSSQNDPLALLPLCKAEPLAIPGETYKLSLTAGLAQAIYIDSGKLTSAELATVLEETGGYVHSENDADWWIPSGRIFHSDDRNHNAAEESAQARAHFFHARRYRDPFHTNAVSTESLITYDAYDLLLVETRDALDNLATVRTEDDDGITAIRLDYRVLQPYWLTDSNGNRSRVAFDTLGMVVGTAVMGKAGEQLGDSLDDFEPDVDAAFLFDHPEDLPALSQTLLKQATTRLVYDLFAYQRTKNQPDPQPTAVYVLVRETHDKEPLPPDGLKFQHSFSYSDGFGREIQKKLQAEPEKIAGQPGPPRWVGSGWTIFNNKGKPVRQYEPFFRPTPRFEFAIQVGVSSTLFYDPLERVVSKLHPNQTWEKVVFTPWQQSTFDVNDTVLNEDGTTNPTHDRDVSAYFKRLPDAEYLPTWYEQRIGLPANDPERVAAEKAAIHAQTPTVAHFDTLGRPFLTITHNRFMRNDAIVAEQYPTRVEMDIEGNQRAVRDAIEQAGDAEGRIVMRYDYDMLGNRIHQTSMEAGERWMLNDVTGKPVYAWDSRGHTFRTEYDPLRRPLRLFVKGANAADRDQELLAERMAYGEQHPQSGMRNLRGKLFLHLDQAGSVTIGANDFKGNALQTTRRLTRDTQYRQTIDWNAIDQNHVALPSDSKSSLDLVALEAALGPRLETDIYRGRSVYDALNRAMQLIPPRSNRAGNRPNVIQPRYNEANLLEGVDVWLDYSTNPEALLDTTVDLPSFVGVRNIDYDAKGRRVSIEYKNQAVTSYEYDRLTFRLINLKTTRPAGSNGGSQLFADPAAQDLRYTYDPVGNITRIADAALPNILYNNERVEPICEYEYDALYRLIEARGREHIGQTAHDFNPPGRNHRDYPFAGLADFSIHANDGQAMRNYTEGYEYDGVGNFVTMRHVANGGSWTRHYEYLEPSLIESAKRSNRLSRTTIGNGVNRVENYLHDAHGNIKRMPHFGDTDPEMNMRWDYRDQLREIDLGGGGIAYYVYDASGQRVRKVCERSANLVEERIYLGGFEIYRRRQGGELLERETLHVMDDKQRIALVETRTIDEADTDPAPEQLIRYQFGNHLGSSSLELDETAQLISYEEYTPYGSTSYQTMRGQSETPKRYRYTGKERDEESGFYYHGARYYACWLGRWVRCDPAGLIDGPSLYAYVNGNPVVFRDAHGLAAKKPPELPPPPGPSTPASPGRPIWERPLEPLEPAPLPEPPSELPPFDPPDTPVELPDVEPPPAREPKIKPNPSTEPPDEQIKRNRPRPGFTRPVPKPVAPKPPQKNPTPKPLPEKQTPPQPLEKVPQPLEKVPRLPEKVPARPPVGPKPGKAGTALTTTNAAAAPTPRPAPGLKAGIATVGNALMVGVATKQAVAQLQDEDYQGAFTTAVVTAASFTPAAPLLLADAIIQKYQTDATIDEEALAAGDAVEQATGSSTLGGIVSAANAVGFSTLSVGVDVVDSVKDFVLLR